MPSKLANRRYDRRTQGNAGGGGQQGGGAPAPVFTSASSGTVAENATLSHTLTATRNPTFSIVGGADQARYEISGSTLRWASNGTKDFEAPDDADTNNTYVVTVRATKGSQTTDQTITITVTNIIDFSLVTLLCGFEGADGSTTIVDESSYGYTLTAVGNAQIDTGVALIGTSSLLLDGTGDRVDAPSATDNHTFGSGPFTVELFVRFSTLDANSRAFMGHGGSAVVSLGWAFGLTPTELAFTYSTDGLTYNQTVVSTGASFTTGVKYYVVADRDSAGKIRLYREGVMIASGTPATPGINNPANRKLSLGALNDVGGQDTAGWLDEVRITKGASRYGDVTGDSNITVPSAAFPRS